jgi:hypothetical protein
MELALLPASKSFEGLKSPSPSIENLSPSSVSFSLGTFLEFRLLVPLPVSAQKYNRCRL